MLLTISTTHTPATDLGFLLHKHPDRVQTFSTGFGEAHVFYPEASEARCIIPIGQGTLQEHDALPLRV